MLRRKPIVGDIVRIGGPVVVEIRTVRRKRGRRTEVVQEIDAPGLTVQVQRRKTARRPAALPRSSGPR